MPILWTSFIQLKYMYICRIYLRNMLLTCYILSIYILYMFYIHFVYMLNPCCIIVIYMLYTFYIHLTCTLYILYTQNTQLLHTFLDTFWTCSGQVWGSKMKFFQKVLGMFGLSFGIIGGVRDEV